MRDKIGEEAVSPDYATLRQRMVAEQIAARGVGDPHVLRAMTEVPRHLFVPREHQGEAYLDRALPIGAGQTISQPYMVAVMTEALAPRETDRVLEIGTGSGYQAAILARLVREVVTIERKPELAAHARAILGQLGFSRVRVLDGDGTEGAPDDAPFDGVIVTAGAPHVPETLQAQLADGGRLVIPVGSPLHQELVVVRRVGAQFHETRREGCVFVPLIGKYGWSGEL